MQNLLKCMNDVFKIWLQTSFDKLFINHSGYILKEMQSIRNIAFS